MKGCLCAVLNGASLVKTLPNVTRVLIKIPYAKKCTLKCVKSAFDHVEGRFSKWSPSENREFQKPEALSAKTKPSCAEWSRYVSIRCLFLVWHAPKTPPVPSVQRAPSPNDGVCSAQWKSKTQCPPVTTPLPLRMYIDSALMFSASCTVGAFGA